MRTARIATILGLAGLLTWASPSLGGPPSPLREAPTAAMTEKSRQLYNEGLKAFGQGRWGDAHAAFVAAWALNPHYTIAGNLGMCEMKLGRYRDAAEHLAIYTREIRKDEAATTAQRDAAQTMYYDARAKVGTVPVLVSPEGAAVAVDGREAGTAPLADPVFVEPGEHGIEARREGYTAKKATVVAKAGGIDPVALWLEPVPVPVAAPVRREEKGATGPAGPGSERPEARSWVPVAVLVGGGVAAAAGVTVGVVFTFLANSKSDDFEVQRGGMRQGGDVGACAGAMPRAECADLRATAEQRNTLSNAAVWSFVGGGVVGVGTLIFGLTSRPSKPDARVQVVPLVGANGIGLSLGGVL